MGVQDRIASLSPQRQAELAKRLRQRGTPERWIVRHRRQPGALLRLFCLPYAAGGASVFRGWGDVLGDDIEVCAVQLPGRESRVGEPAHTRIEPLVADLAVAIAPLLDRPFALYGHSMGALVAFELARYLRRNTATAPVRLMVGAFRAPQLPNPNIKICHLPEEVLKVVLRADGTPLEILQNEQLMQAMLPTLRADLEVCETYQYVSEPPLPYPLSIFGGHDDVRVGAADLDEWRVHTEASATRETLPGGHFFVHSAQDLLLAAVARNLAAHLQLQHDGAREESHV